MKTTNKTKLNISIKRALAMSCLSATLGMMGCPDGSSEQAGQRMGSAAKNADKVIDKSDKVAKQELEGLKDSLDSNAEQAKENIDKSTDASKKELEKSKDKVDENSTKAKDKVEQIKENVEKKLDDIKGSTTEKTETMGESIDDSVITIKVKSAILGSTWLGASHIEVNTNKGVVLLSGTVDTELNIARAIEVARSQENVKAVDTDLIVSFKASRN
jgi:hyperosmotically inducible periplasmic protein